MSALRLLENFRQSKIKRLAAIQQAAKNYLELIRY